MININSPRALFYNGLAILSVAIGLINATLTMRILGATLDADIWLLAIAMIGTLCIFSQIGVEQFLYHFEEQRAVDITEAKRFLRAAAIWAFISGLVLASIAALAASSITMIFAAGMAGPSRARVAELVIAMAPQIAAAPLLHVTRQHQNSIGNHSFAYLLLLWSPIVLTAILLTAFCTGRPLEGLAWITGAGGCVQILICLLIIIPHVRNHDRLYWSSPRFRSFVTASIAMRSGHALHNIFASAIINSTLSAFSHGSVAIFHYATKFTAGVSAVSVGPHANIFQSRVAKSWAEKSGASTISAAKEFMKNTGPIYALCVSIVWLMIPDGINYITNDDFPTEGLQLCFLFLCLWNGIGWLESVFTNLVIAANRAGFIILINGFFAISFFSFSKALTVGTEYTALPIAGALAQSISLGFYAILAIRLFDQNLGGVNNIRIHK
jgi:hypothetical protein